jgi:plastocyanin
MHNIHFEKQLPVMVFLTALLFVSACNPAPTSRTTITTTTTTAQTTTPPPTSTPTPTTSLPPGPPVTINLSAQGIAFDMQTISVPAGASVTINFNNKDGGIPHNFSLYTDSTATPPALFQGDIITGPATATYTFTAPGTPGTYFFRCDIHPLQMTGTFIVTPKATTPPATTPPPTTTTQPATTSPPPSPQTYAVTISNFSFSPATITIKVGSTVTWTNKDGTTHTVTSNSGVFDSGNLAPNATFSYTFNSAGSFSYHCSIHTYMTGTIVVQ